MYLVVFVSILGVSFIFSLVGLGGAIIYVPLLDWLGQDIKSVAIPTALLLNSVATGSASITHFRKGKVDLSIAIPILVASVMSAPAGAYLTRFIETKLLLLLYCLGLGLASMSMFFFKPEANREPRLSSIKVRIIGGILIGLFVGFVAGLLGIGGGIILIPLLVISGIPLKEAVGCSTFIISISSLSGFLGHLSTAQLDLYLIVWTLPAAVIGSQLGSLVMQEKMRTRRVKQIFGLVILGIIAKILYGIFFSGFPQK